MKVAYNRFWREKFNEEEAKSGKPRGTSCSIRLLKCRRPVAVLVNIALNSSYLSAGKNCSEILGQDRHNWKTLVGKYRAGSCGHDG